MTLVPTDTDPQVTDLQQRLASTDAGVRRVALLDFADVEDETLLPAIAALLRQDPDPALRAEAARALAGWDDGNVVDALADALADEPGVREAAAQALAELKDAAAGSRLVHRVGHEDGFVCAAVLRALKELRIAAAAGPATAALAHADAAVRREAVGVLGWLRHAPALPELAHLAQGDGDAEVRRAATGSLGLADPDRAASVLPALCAALRDAAWQVREEAATTLGKLAQPLEAGAQRAAACSALRQAMEDDYWQVRLRAARSLGRLRDATSLPVLIEALTHRAGNLRKEAAIALGEVGDVRALPALDAADADPDPEVRKAARIARQRLQ
ncbi:HEAT repeat domain-containing protein [Piscinibacter sp. XHJ-5]|uniref:HEAT repeat domain-containing protein n=1 Tax=Piscinibacter sp. XHJ-5 TaxID=3037797 RepID=UPI002452E610|nr:HEAT repeat domain-containing protein [Piscinibacter sp. XHJ-5]